MSNSYRNGFEFIVELSEKSAALKRKNGQRCNCPYSTTLFCGSWCPHFVIESCSIAEKKCQLVLSCGKYVSRYVEIV